MKEVFVLSSLHSAVRKDGDVDITVRLTTQVAPSYAGTLLEKLTPCAHRFVIVTIQNQEQSINFETGEVSNG